MRRCVYRLLCPILLIFSAGHVTADPADNRYVFIISPKPPSDIAKQGLDAWVLMLSNNSRSLLQDVANRPVSVVFRLHEGLLENDTLESWWKTQRSLFAVGAVAVSNNEDKDSTYIDSDVFLGDLKGDLERPYLHFGQAIRPNGYQSSRDALAILTLYTYSVDLTKGLKAGDNPHAACLPLQKANLYERDLDAATAAGLKPLLTAIRSGLDRLACGGKP